MYELDQQDLDYCERVVCLGNAANKYLTIMLAHAALDEGIPGDFAECGVLSGGHPALMAQVLRRRGITDRRVHLYDSFQGAPMAGLEDDHEYQKIHGVNPDRHVGKFSGLSAFSISQTRENMCKWDVPELLLEYHPGWFQEVLPRETSPILALLRLDCNFFDSTLPIMEHLYPRMPAGAFIISDDWGDGPTAPCRRAVLKHIPEPQVTSVPGQKTTVWWRKT